MYVTYWCDLGPNILMERKESEPDMESLCDELYFDEVVNELKRLNSPLMISWLSVKELIMRNSIGRKRIYL